MSSEVNPEDVAKNAFASPTKLTARLTGKSSEDGSVGGSVSSGLKAKNYEDSDAASIYSMISNTTSVKTGKRSSSPKTEGRVTPPSQVSVSEARQDGSLSPTSDTRRMKIAAAKATVSKKQDPPTPEVDPELLRSIEKLVDIKQAAATSQSPSSSDIMSLTKQIAALAETRRESLARSAPNSTATTPKVESTPKPRATPPPHPSRQTKQVAPTLQPAVKTKGKQLDMKNNDNAFSVIANLVFEAFAKGPPLSEASQTQLNRTVPAHVREGFVEAVRFRLQHNCPPDSTEHIHVVTRKCHDLGFHEEADSNPLFASENQKVTNKVLAMNERNTPKANMKPGVTIAAKGTGLAQPRSIQPNAEVKVVEVSTSEILARQQLAAELREASNFMAESKTKEASNFWRNHVLELQGRLRTLHGEPPTGAKATDDDILEANRKLLGATDPLSEKLQRHSGNVPSRQPRSGQPTTVSTSDSGISTGTSYGVTSVTTSQSYISSATSSSAEGWLEDAPGALVMYGVIDLASLEKLYELIDVLIALLEVNKLIDLIAPEKIAKNLDPAKLQEALDPAKFREFLEQQGYGEYIDSEKFMEDLERELDPELYAELLKEMTSPETFRSIFDSSRLSEVFSTEKLRESMNLDKIRDLMPGNNLRDYFVAHGEGQTWNFDELRNIMNANRLREVLDSGDIRDALRPQTLRNFMGNTYREENSMVDVVAPSSLPGGYRFEAEIDGHRFLATVPETGVRQGETFTCIMKDLDTVYSPDIPVGGWRDRLCDCFINGSCHPVIWTTVFCPLLALGQIMTRLRFDFLGRRQRTDKSTFAVMQSVIIMWLTLNLAVFGAFNYKWSQRIELSIGDYCALVLVNLTYLVYAVVATASTRSALREKYMIREHRFYDLEDCCCATLCLSCTICQMARHTANYAKYEAACCSETGLEDENELPNTGSEGSGSNYFCADKKRSGRNYFCAET